MAYLDDHPPERSQFRDPRREPVSGVVVVHTAENTPDVVATDGGAEAVARFIQSRDTPGSYHDLVDSDSCIALVRWDCEAYHDATGSNRHSYGVSVATTAAWWPLAPKEWRDGAVEQAAAAAARYARWVRTTRGITIPARRINRAQSEARMPGFISHAERDPARRSDPGAEFPWDQFLNAYARHMGMTEEDDMSQETVAEGVELAVKPGGRARDDYKTLIIGSVGHGLHDPGDGPAEPGEGDLREPFKQLLREVLDEAGLTAPSVPPAG